MYLYGASGHGEVISEIAEVNSVKVDAFIDIDKNKKHFFGYPVINTMPDGSFKLLISIGNNQTRKKIAEQYPDCHYISMFHPKSVISKSAEIGIGTVVMAGVTINANVLIKKHCIINTNASVDHDCELDDFVHISPNVALAGRVKVGEGTHIGIGASVIQDIKIGKWCTIGAGAVIIRDVPDGATVVGNPGRIIRIKN